MTMALTMRQPFSGALQPITFWLLLFVAIGTAHNIIDLECGVNARSVDMTIDAS